ncbi:DUF3253 domain-containing protein [Mucilaginibacter sp. HMF7410]|uniref:DUF3253 domain-containing protein n=2 Tax=Mucilaginibacter arboris TaxID=2682090 RepID=A0A7K1STA5_9SPHI|nr:DUF3253 domain-containing protein [Mucilaginibacter arboris]
MATVRGADKTICPSEVARAMFGENWRSEMQTVRDAAFDLSAKKQVIILQKGKKVGLANLKGPIRIQINTSTENN